MTRTNKLVVIFYVCASAMCFVACGADKLQEGADSGLEYHEQSPTSARESAYASSSRVWPAAENISVCFLNGSTQSRQIVQQAIADSFQFWSGLTFSGWATCSSATGGAADIKINLGTELSSAIGTDSTSQYPSMQLRSNEARTGQRYQDALHEFAHSVALYHESDRSSEPHSDGVTFGTYDDYSTSLVTYNFLGGGGVSQKDVDFLQYYYPGLSPDAARVFDPTYYLSHNSSVGSDLGLDPSEDDLASHWATVGLRECLRASPKFDPAFYTQANRALLEESKANYWGKDIDLGDGGCLGAVVNYVRNATASGRDPASSFVSPEAAGALVAAILY